MALEERPEPEPIAPDDAVVRVDATGICGSDLHIYHGRVQLEPGFTIGHEYVGTIVAAGDAVRLDVGTRVLGTFHTACGVCFFCRRGIYQKCDEARVFGHGATLGSLQGTQAEQALVPRANLTLRRVPEGLSDAAALFAGDVMGTGYHAIVAAGFQPGDTCAVIGLGPVGLCAVMAARAAGASKVFAVDTVEARLDTARSLGAEPVHATEEDPRKAVKGGTQVGGVDVAVEAVGHPRGAGDRVPAGAQGRHCLGGRRLRRARRGAHGHRLDQEPEARHGPRQRDGPPRLGAGDARLGPARSRAAGEPGDAARGRGRGL